MSDLEKLFEIFEAEQDQLLVDHRGEFALVADGAVQGTYVEQQEAMEKGIEIYGLGNFLVQEILPPGQRVVEYHSRVIFRANAS